MIVYIKIWVRNIKSVCMAAVYVKKHETVSLCRGCGKWKETHATAGTLNKAKRPLKRPATGTEFDLPCADRTFGICNDCLLELLDPTELRKLKLYLLYGEE